MTTTLESRARLKKKLIVQKILDDSTHVQIKMKEEQRNGSPRTVLLKTRVDLQQAVGIPEKLISDELWRHSSTLSRPKCRHRRCTDLGQTVGLVPVPSIGIPLRASGGLPSRTPSTHQTIPYSMPSNCIHPRHVKGYFPRLDRLSRIQICCDGTWNCKMFGRSDETDAA